MKHNQVGRLMALSLRPMKDFADDDGIHSIKWHRGDATSMPFDDAAFDILLCH
jgi:ubiquinone/menaquinone biosynthesis C-methylase UbiE